ncbi:MAG: hypothetical protein IPO21_00910 [Bacteroidales bacterium]|nr:hypothetical protein [Bacteroidales bacterium]
METHKIDSVIKKAINESENYYSSDANIAKERIWNHIQREKQNQSKPIMLRLLVAASILLFISLSIITISNIRNRNTINTLVELNRKLKNEATINVKNTIKKESIIATNVIIHDTIIIEKKVIEYKPLATTKHFTDTVYIQQIVYVKQEQKPDFLITNEKNCSTDSVIQKTGNNYKSEILISNNQSLKRKKVKKIQIKFGGNKDQIDSGTLAFTKRF